MMLKGTDLTVSRSAEGVMMISPRETKKIEEQEGMSKRLKNSASVFGLLGVLAAVPVHAQDGDSMETVVITGSRLAVSSAFDAPTPVSVVSDKDIQQSGTVNVESLLSQSPQFTPSTWGGQTGNTIQPNGESGAALVNLRGLGEVRNLVLVNGRRYTIQGSRLTTDINTIPASLIERTEVVTGGNSAVYGSDAISGVVNFVMKQNFQGVAGNAQYTFDQFTTSPIYNFDMTVGGNFDHDKGNVVMAVNYLSRKGFTGPDHGGWTNEQYQDSCITAASYSPNKPGVRLPGVATGAACVAAGGVNGFVAGGSGDVPNGYIYQIPTYAQALTLANDPLHPDPTLKNAYDAAGLANMTSDGILFANNGSSYPGAIRNRDTNSDLYNLVATNYMQIPEQRWMLNSFAHYTFNPKIEGYAEFHFSSNTVSAQLTPSNANGFMLFDTHDPAFPTALQGAFDYLDAHETGTSCIAVGSSSVCTSPNDGVVKIGYGKRFVENGMRRQDANRVAWRFAGGLRGVLGNVDPDFLKDVTYDVYYTFARTQETDRQSGSISRTNLQKNVLAATNGGTPVCDLFGIGSLSQSCIDAITVNSSVLTIAEMQDINASITGTAFDLPAGPVQFVVGTEWRYTSAQYQPDAYSSSGDVAGINAASPTRGSMVAHEAFGELRVPVLTGLPFVEKFTVNGAFRYSTYNLSGAKNIWTWSAGGDWRVIPDLTFRGQFQRAIRAPNVGELYGGNKTNSQPFVDPCGTQEPSGQRTDTVKALCLAQGVPLANLWTSAVQSPVDLLSYNTGGNPDLAPETSDTITLGAVITPEAVPGLAASLDFYSIDVKNMINPLAGGVGGVMSNCFGQTDPGNLYCQQIHRVGGLLTLGSGGYVNATNANISSLKTQGIDFNGQYSFEVGWGLLSDAGRFDVSSAWNWLLEMVSLPDTTAPTVKSSCAGAYGNTYCFYQPMPRLKGSSRIVWNDGPLSFSLKWRYLGPVALDTYIVPLRRGSTSVAPENFTRPFLPDMSYFDVSATWDVNDNIQIYGGINNLLSKDPPVMGTRASFANSFPGVYDAFGRVTFIGIKAKTN
jgi:iron complex outermembrane recepter protein